MTKLSRKMISSLNWKSLSCALFLVIILITPVYAQITNYTIAPESNIYVDGTSNQTPEWRVYATEITGTVNLNEEGNVDTAQIVVPSKMMKSKKSPIMDRGMYDALQANDFPEIIYKLASVSDVTASNDTMFTLNATGNLTIAAETKEINLPVEGIRKPGGAIHFRGTHELLMTDYGLKPPSLMFGRLRTGDELVITFEIVAVPAE
ncbi:MAG: YceI family protein [Bacteroidetes bacterium]|nr:YceI family protein [Bacteroidota bacterium]MCY4206156.1 YceI family protein [Bacteroidota bacterium]